MSRGTRRKFLIFFVWLIQSVVLGVLNATTMDRESPIGQSIETALSHAGTPPAQALALAGSLMSASRSTSSFIFGVLLGLVTINSLTLLQFTGSSD